MRMRILAALALAGGLIAVPAATAGAAPPSTTCDGAGCVSYVNRGVELGGPCNGGTRWVYGLDASGNTLRCGTPNTWRASGPLVGVRTNSSSCEGESGVAQSPDGLPLSCIDGRWRHDFNPSFY
jgi:hypothetical protein